MDDIGYLLWRVSRHMMDFIEAQTIEPIQPYTEFSEDDDGASLTCELSNVEPSDIRVDIHSEGIRLRVVTNSITSYKKDFHSSGLDRSSAIVSYKNGILTAHVSHL